jgi:hypothetical protein
MLSQLEFKLTVEQQYKAGIEKMARLYEMEGDRRSKQDAQTKLIESNQKIQLLKHSFKRYADLHVNIDGDDDGDGECLIENYTASLANPGTDDSLSVPSQRKPLSGHLSLRIHAVADVDHAATGRFSRGPETFINIKVEDAIKGRTKPSRNDRWVDENHEFNIDKANEIEITVYDKTGDHLLPIGMLWVRISDIAEEMRRKKIETELQNSGWVAADRMGGNSGIQPDVQFQPPPGQNFAGAGAPGPGGMRPTGGAQPQTGPVMIDDWFSLEPVGRIHLTMSFGEHQNNLTGDPVLTEHSKTHPQQAGLRRWSWSQGCRSPTQGRGRRTVWPQVRAAAVLQHYALLALRRFPQILSGHAVY